jgi:beta-barrel assembly-enhancing protease
VSLARRSGERRRRAPQRACAAALLALVLGTAGCVTEEQEQEIGDNLASEVNPHLPLITDPVVVVYVNALGRRLAAVSERPEVPYRFYVVNSAMVNAFALPGGHIYVNRGLIDRTETASELAAVLAHEIGHVAARHGAQQLQRHLRTRSVVSTLYSLFLRGEPAILEQRSFDLAGELWFARHSRRDEKEADRLSVRYMARAGLDPEGILTLMEGLLQEEAAEPATRTAEWFSTHPLTQRRVEVISREIERKREVAPPATVTDLASYPHFLQRLRTLPPPADADPPHP